MHCAHRASKRNRRAARTRDDQRQMGMSWNNFAAVGVGAAFGAWLRWGMGHALNVLWPQLPPGTLAVNVVGGYLAGLALGWFTLNPGIAPEVRLLLLTGFLGSLTTFSTFSVEAFGLLARQQYGWAFAHIGLHLVGSIVATGLGFATLRLL